MKSGIDISYKELKKLQNSQDGQYSQLMAVWDNTQKQLDRMRDEEIFYPFCSRGAIDVVGYILDKQRSFELNDLMRLVYQIERHAIATRYDGYPILGGRYFLTDYGIVVKNLLDMATNQHPDSDLWFEYFQMCNKKVILRKTSIRKDWIFFGKLSESICNIIDQKLYEFQTGKLDKALPETCNQKINSFISYFCIAQILGVNTKRAIDVARDMTMMNLLCC